MKLVYCFFFKSFVLEKMEWKDVVELPFFFPNLSCSFPSDCSGICGKGLTDSFREQKGDRATEMPLYRNLFLVLRL